MGRFEAFMVHQETDKIFSRACLYAAHPPPGSPTAIMFLRDVKALPFYPLFIKRENTIARFGFDGRFESGRIRCIVKTDKRKLVVYPSAKIGWVGLNFFHKRNLSYLRKDSKQKDDGRLSYEAFFPFAWVSFKG
jgi:hypothetical protein